jgi:predicted transposase/invertase (TIGR01784 family)
MEGVGPAVSRFAVQGHDLIECKTFTPEADHFLELLTHVSYFVQLPKLPPKHQTRVGHILSVFSQHWIHDQDNKRLMLPDELKADSMLGPIVKRLENAFADEATRKMLVEEEAFERTLLKSHGVAEAIGEQRGLVKGRAEGKAEGKAEAKLEIARNMLPLVADDAVIAAATGVAVDQVRALRAEPSSC